MIQRGHIVQPVDYAICDEKGGEPGLWIVKDGYAIARYHGSRDVPRLSSAEIRELQDAHNVNTCDECDDWLDAETDSGLTELSEEDSLNFLIGE